MQLSLKNLRKNLTTLFLTSHKTKAEADSKDKNWSLKYSSVFINGKTTFAWSVV